MTLKDIRNYKEQFYQIAAQYNIIRVLVFGSVARGEGTATSDIDFLIELQAGASALGVGGFQYEIERLLGLRIDVIPTFVLPEVEDCEFVRKIRSNAVVV